MSTRASERVLDDILSGRGRGAIIQRKLAANRDRNWLLALTLHSFAKSTAGAELTELESGIVAAYRQNGFDEEGIATQARLWQAIPDAARDEFFPAKYAHLGTDDRYSAKELADDANEIVSAVMAMPVSTVVEVDAVMNGTATLRDFALPRNATVHQYGSQLVEAKSSAAPRDSNQPYFIKAYSFRCIDRASDAKFGPSNEPFWIFGTIGGGETTTTSTGVFADVDNGEKRYFGPSEGCIWSKNCAREPLPDGDIGILAQLWEHDEGNIEAARAGVAAAFAAASGVLVATGVAAWVGAVTAGVGAVVGWLLGYSNDDHIADQTIVFNRATIMQMVPDRRGGYWDVTRKFSDGDANYDLTVRVYGKPSPF